MTAWEWAVQYPAYRDGPLDRVWPHKSEAEAREDYAGWLRNLENGHGSRAALVRRPIPDWEVVEERSVREEPAS